MEKNKIRIGQITKSHGLKGEFKIYPYTSDISAFLNYKDVYVEDKKEKYSFEYVKKNNNMLIAKFKDIDNINDLPSFLNKNIFIDYKDKRKMEKDEYLVSDLIGLEVYEKDIKIGIVEDVLLYAANDVFKVKDTDIEKERFIPNVKQFIKNINIQENKIEVELIEGM